MPWPRSGEEQQGDEGDFAVDAIASYGQQEELFPASKG